MDHPGIDEIVEGTASSRAHLAACERCKALVPLFDLPSADDIAGAASGDLEELPTIDAAVYGEWVELSMRGGMGRVFRVRDRRLHRFVAIKQPLRRGVGGSEGDVLLQRFEREALLTARLQHPSIVGVHEAGRFENGQPFYAMPYLAGAPLSDAIAQRKGLAARLALLPNLTAVAEAVAYAHQQGIVHRDLKPDNILVGTFGETVVVDWGLAKDLAEGPDASFAAPGPLADGLTELGVGTPQYMPPEQARGEDPDVRVDVYALGATLYHLLSGAPPYGLGKSVSIRLRLAKEPPPPLAELAPETPPELLDIVARAMERDPGKRYATAQELADELRRYQTGQLLQSRRYTALELLAHFARRHRASLRMAAAGLVALVALAALAFFRIARERDLAQKSQRVAERELRRAQGAVASRLAPDPLRRLEAIELGVRAVGPELAAGVQPAAEALQGLFDALAAGPALRPLAHDGAIKSFARTADGALLFGVDDAKTLMAWNGRTGALLKTLKTALPEPERLGVSPDGARVVVCGNDPAAEVFTLASGGSAHVDTKNDVIACDFLPDGRLILAADEVTVREPGTLAIVQRLPLPAPAAGMALRPDGLVAVSALDGSLWLWKPGGEARALALRGPSANTLRFDARGEHLIASGSDQAVRSWPVSATGAAAPTVLLEDRTTIPHTLLLSPDGSLIAAGTFDRDGAHRTEIFDGAGARTEAAVQASAVAWAEDPRWYFAESKGPLALLDARSGHAILTLAGAEAHECRALFAGGLLAWAGEGGPAFLWNLRQGGETGLLLGHSGEIVSISPRPGGDGVFTASLDGTARIWAEGRERAVLEATSEVLAAAWAPDGSAVVTGGLDGTARRFDASSGRLLAVYALGAPISALAFSPDGGSVLIGSLGGRLELLSSSLGSPRALAAGGAAVTAAAFSPDGRGVASAHADGSTRLWDAAALALVAGHADTEPIDEATDHDGHAGLLFAADGSRLYAARPSGHSLVFRAQDLTLLATLEGRLLGGPGPASLSPDGTRLVTAAKDGTLLLHDLASGVVQRLEGHRAAVVAVGFSPDGKRLASGAADGQVRVWDAAAGAPLASVDAAGLGAATAVAMTGDQWLYAGYSSGAVRLHPATAAAALERGCALLRRFGEEAKASPYCDPAR